VHTDAEQLSAHWWWRPGWQVGTRYYAWHVVFDDDPVLRDLLAPVQEALRPFDVLDVIPGQWLHMTLHGVGHVGDVPDSERDGVLAGVRSRLAALEPVPVTFRRPVVVTEGVVVDPVEAEPVHEVHRAVVAGTAQGRSVPQEDNRPAGFWPHVTLAYANATAGTRDVRAALDAVESGTVSTTVRHVALIEMHRDHRMYEWQVVERVPLGPA
jgi:2'-5' RNA ligase